MNTYLYKSVSFTAQEIAENKLQDALEKMLKQDYVIQSTHTVRASDGDDLLVVIFQPEHWRGLDAYRKEE